MASYRVLIRPSAVREIDDVGQKKDRQRIVAGIRALARDPRPAGCQKLSGELDRYRLRVVRYRIVYSVGDSELLVVVVRVSSWPPVMSSKGGIPRLYAPRDDS